MRVIIEEFATVAVSAHRRVAPARVRRVLWRLALCLLAGPVTGLVNAQTAPDAQAKPGERMESSVQDEPDKQIIAPSAEPDTQAALHAAWRELGDDYTPRTEHFLASGEPKYINRLIQEDSPYLLQHAHNPVDWYPWGEEAFARARAEDRPIFLSIGYATCHWCHVMERESFENEAIAQLLNDYFVPVKVDREQLPDVDALYMTAVQMLTGSGGWPMSSFLDTDGRPFYGGTYFPPSRFSELLDRVSVVWATDQDAILDSATDVANALERVNKLAEHSQAVGDREIKAARQALLSSHDSEYGGFGRAPKFPQESTLLFLLELARRDADAEALAAVDATLRHMSAGGIHDQIGGGFHRYSVDARWQVPHFEKMLYNQAGLARAYTLGWQLTGEPEHQRTARGILDYVLREMTAPDGLFYSATDADSEGREGAYFVWTPESLAAALEEPNAVQLAARLWGVDDVGNFEQGETVLHRPEPLEKVADALGIEAGELRRRQDALAETLREARAMREAPLRDDKILSGWNGLMITAFAEAGHAFGEQRYIDAARRAADTLWDSAWDDSIGLSRSQFRGESGISARQTDHAWLAEAMLALHDIAGQDAVSGNGDGGSDGGSDAQGEGHAAAGAESRWLSRARTLTDAMLERFLDPDDGGLFLGDAEVKGARLMTRPKDIHDASTPSGNGVALRVLTRLHGRTGESRYREQADQLIDAFAGTLVMRQGGLSSLLIGLAEHVGGESGATRYSSRGLAQVRARAIDDQQVEVVIDLQPGWHVNSSTPLQDYLIPTRLSSIEGQDLEDVHYPEPVQRRLGFQSETLSLYEGHVVLRARMPGARDDQRIAPVVVDLQTCSDRICLAPESLTLNVSLAGSSIDD